MKIGNQQILIKQQYSVTQAYDIYIHSIQVAQAMLTLVVL